MLHTFLYYENKSPGKTGCAYEQKNISWPEQFDIKKKRELIRSASKPMRLFANVVNPGHFPVRFRFSSGSSIPRARSGSRAGSNTGKEGQSAINTTAKSFWSIFYCVVSPPSTWGNRFCPFLCRHPLFDQEHCATNERVCCNVTDNCRILCTFDGF